MGIFTDKCTNCGEKVKKAARFCNKCGTGAPNGWAKCSSCSKWVGIDSEFCWSCKHPLHPDQQAAIAGGRWIRTTGVFAQRLDVGDLKALFQKGLIIEQGNLAILLEDGKYKETLAAGTHNLDSAASTLLRFGLTLPKTVVMVDTGEVGLPLRVSDLKTKEGMSVDFYAEGIFEFDPAACDALVSHLPEGDGVINYGHLGKMLAGDLKQVLQSHCMATSIDELFKDPDRRLKLEATMETAFKEVLIRYGLKFNRLAGMDFTGAAYEKLRRQASEVEVARRQVEYDTKLRELMTPEKMAQFKDEHELEEYARQLAQERDLGDADRGHELDILKQAHRHDLELSEAGHKLELSIREREKQIADANLEAAVQEIRTQQELKDTRNWMEVKKEKRQAANDDLKEKADIFVDMSLEQMLATVDDPARRDHLLKLYELQAKAGVNEKELLADAKLEALEEQKKLTVENAEKLENLMTQALKSMSGVAKGKDALR